MHDIGAQAPEKWFAVAGDAVLLVGHTLQVLDAAIDFTTRRTASKMDINEIAQIFGYPQRPGHADQFIHEDNDVRRGHLHR